MLEQNSKQDLEVKLKWEEKDHKEGRNIVISNLMVMMIKN